MKMKKRIAVFILLAVVFTMILSTNALAIQRNTNSKTVGSVTVRGYLYDLWPAKYQFASETSCTVSSKCIQAEVFMCGGGGSPVNASKTNNDMTGVTSPSVTLNNATSAAGSHWAWSLGSHDIDVGTTYTIP